MGIKHVTPPPEKPAKEATKRHNNLFKLRDICDLLLFIQSFQKL